MGKPARREVATTQGKKVTQEKKPSMFSQNWREKISLSAYLTGFISLAVFIMAMILAYNVFSILRENKYRDMTSIMFLELEKQTTLMSDVLESFENRLKFTTNNFNNLDNADLILRIEDEDGHLFAEKTNDSRNFVLFDFGMNSTVFAKPTNILQLAGVNYYVKKLPSVKFPKKLSLYFWKIDLLKLMHLNERLSTENRIYIVSREFKIIYKNSMEISEEGLGNRELIKNFISSSIRKGQLKYSQGKKNFYGFFSEIQNTNLILFSETSEDVITYMIFQLLQSFAVGVFIILGVAVILLQFIYPTITSPLKELVYMSRQISLGNFNIKAQAKGFGEITQLVQAFSRMKDGLKRRDSQIIELMADKRERDRLDNEFQIAKKIQENFLPQTSAQPREGIRVDTYYLPADQVAGDWYQQFYDESSNEFTAIIADVSGHGAGSSMFTAVIAAMFENFKLKRKDGYTIINFVTDLNAVLLRLGKKEWHATLIAAVVSADRKKMHLVCCGHQFPMLIEKSSGANLVKSIRLPSSPLGLSETVEISEKQIDVTSTMTLLLFTDGIIEAVNPEQKSFGRKRLVKVCENARDILPSLVLEDVMMNFREYCRSQKPMDDICLYALGVS